MRTVVVDKAEYIGLHITFLTRGGSYSGTYYIWKFLSEVIYVL
jgi:hypothetical protein